MTQPVDLVDVAREGLLLALTLSLPLLGAALIAALLFGLFQSFTRMSEPALTYVPRIAAVFLTGFAAAPWIGNQMAGFAERVWSLIQVVGH
jgi:flagellar biosynthetic protein FliQ